MSQSFSKFSQSITEKIIVVENSIVAIRDKLNSKFDKEN